MAGMRLPITPFKVEREWKYMGFQCTVVLAREHGHRCGYVRVPPDHPAFGKKYDDDAVIHLSVHGGLTFAELEPCTEHEDGQGWRLGFDFIHSGDKSDEPGYEPEYLKKYQRLTSELGLHEHYWTQREVERECESLAEELFAMRPLTLIEKLEGVTARLASAATKG